MYLCVSILAELGTGSNMPRRARIDAPGALHHIICRGIERRVIFQDDTGRDNFVTRPLRRVTRGH
jgi:putative transposase